jgi:hypothetical protein
MTSILDPFDVSWDYQYEGNYEQILRRMKFYVGNNCCYKVPEYIRVYSWNEKYRFAFSDRTFCSDCILDCLYLSVVSIDEIMKDSFIDFYRSMFTINQL